MQNARWLLLFIFGFAFAQTPIRINNPQPGADDQFGQALASDGNRVLVGAPQDDTGSGAVFVYELQGNVYVQTARLTAGDRTVGDNFGNALALEGNRAVIGALKDNLPAGSGAGSAYVFELENGAWVQRAKLLAPDGATGDAFGTSVDLSGDQIVIGAPQDDVNGVGQNAGSAYVFTRSANSWSIGAQIFASNGRQFEGFGGAVAVSGENVLVSARDADGDAGAVYAFRSSGGTVIFQSKLVSDDRGATDAFGSALALDGEAALIGAQQHADAAGAAYVFRRIAGTWTQQAKLTHAAQLPGDQFGASAALLGAVAVVGAPKAANGIACCTQRGSAHVFQTTGGQWLSRARLIASDSADFDNLGASIALTPSEVFAGAPLSGVAPLDAGSVVQFAQPLPIFRDGFE